MSLPYFAMYPTDFDAKTAHLTLAEDGAYNRLLRLQWAAPGCKLPADLPWIMRKVRAVSSTDQATIQGIIAEFFTRKGGKIFSDRLLKEWVKSSAANERRILAGSKGGIAKALKAKEIMPSNATAMLKQPEPEPEPYKKEAKASYAQQSRFDEFWDVYPHRNGTKRKRGDAELKYAAAVKSGVSEQSIIDGAKRSALDRQVIDGYARDPVSWLNQRGWKDEIPDQPTEHQNGKPTGQDRLNAFLAGASSAPRLDSWPDSNPSQPLLAGR